MIPEIAEFLFQKDEPARSCLLAARKHILQYRSAINEVFKFNMPFFYYKGQQVCYLSVYKKDGTPYIGFVEGKRFEHPSLEKGERVRIKILRLHSETGLPVDVLDSVLDAALSLYD